MNRNSRLWKTILRIRQTILRIRQWFRRMKMLARLNRLPGQLHLSTVIGPIELANKLALGDRTVYSIDMPAKFGSPRRWKVILLGLYDQKTDLESDTVDVIRVMEGRLWPQFVRTVSVDQLDAEGYAVNVALEEGKTLLDIVLSV